MNILEQVNMKTQDKIKKEYDKHGPKDTDVMRSVIKKIYALLQKNDIVCSIIKFDTILIKKTFREDIVITVDFEKSYTFYKEENITINIRRQYGYHGVDTNIKNFSNDLVKYICDQDLGKRE